MAETIPHLVDYHEVPDKRDKATAPTKPAPVGDLKAGLTSDRPKLSIVPAAGELYQCRAMEYGAEKYHRGNYHGIAPDQVTEAERIMGYIDAAMRHLRAVADSFNRATGIGGVARDSLAVVDDRASGGFPPSGLPHLAHAMASVSLAIQCGVDDGILPQDPGQPWRKGVVKETRSPEAAKRHEEFTDGTNAHFQAIAAGKLSMTFKTGEAGNENPSRSLTCSGCKFEKVSSWDGSAGVVFRKDPRCEIHGVNRPGQCVTKPADQP